jgi:hypothetical protein
VVSSASRHGAESDRVIRGTGRDLGLGRCQCDETELRSQPAVDLFDCLVRLWHATSAPDEVVLAFGEGMQADVDAGVFRSLCELDGFPRQHLMGAVVDHNRRKADQISVKHVDPRIIPGHAPCRRSTTPGTFLLLALR